MKYKAILSIIFSLALVALSATSCNETNPEGSVISGDIDQGDFMDVCTPIYRGYSTAFEKRTEDLTIYKTDIVDEYYIPGFFNGKGEIFFKWDKTTNLIRMEESYYLDGDLPVYMMTQNSYEGYLGKYAKTSRYYPELKTFLFNVIFLLETLDGMVYAETELSFTVTSTINQDLL